MPLSSRCEELLQSLAALALGHRERAELARAIARTVPGGASELGHVSFGVRDLARAIAFYDAALPSLGYVRVWTEAAAAGYGPPGHGDCVALFERPAAAAPGAGFHVALTALDRDAVDRFHAAGLGAGGTDAGAPGLRAHYGASYYACFVVDPDGHKLEAVCQLG